MTFQVDERGNVLKSYVYEIFTPKSAGPSASAAVALIDQILTSLSRCVFRIAAENGRVVWQLLILDVDNPPDLTPAIRSVVPGAEVEIRPYTLPEFGPNTSQHFIAPIVQTHQWFVPTARLDQMDGDPLTFVAQAMAEATKQDVTAYLTFSVAGLFDNQRNMVMVSEAKRITMGLPSDAQKIGATLINVGGFIGTMFFRAFEEQMLDQKLNTSKVQPLIRHPQPQAPDAIQRRVLDKIDGFKKQYLTGMLEVYGPSREVVVSTLGGVLTHIESGYQDIGSFTIAPESAVGDYQFHVAKHQARLNQLGLPGYLNWLNTTPDILQKIRMVVTMSELAALWHLPHSGMAAPEIEFLNAGRPSNAILANTEGNTLGLFRNQPICIKDVDRRSHINIVGKSGTGKSTLMLNLIKQDILKNRGVGVIDPHGKLVEDILATSIPEDRWKDVVLIDVADTDFPPPLNPLRLTDLDGKVAAGQLTAILERIYGDSNRYPRADVFLRSAIQTLNYETQPTVRDIVRLFHDVEYRIGLLQRAEDGGSLDEATYAFWTDVFASLSDSQQRDYPFPVVHRVSTFYGSDFLYPMLCHPDSLDWRGLMEANKIILVSLAVDSAKVSEKERQLLGTLALSQMEVAAKRHGHAQPLDFHLYVDEVQRFTNTSLPNMFEEIRKYGVHLTVANQYLDQLRGEMLSALMGNVGATFIFEVGKDDARDLEIYTEPTFERNALASLGKFHTVAVMKLDDNPQPPFDFRPQPEPDRVSNATEAVARIRQLSRDAYTPKSRSDILDWLKARYPRRRITAATSIAPSDWGEVDAKALP